MNQTHADSYFSSTRRLPHSQLTTSLTSLNFTPPDIRSHLIKSSSLLQKQCNKSLFLFLNIFSVLPSLFLSLTSQQPCRHFHLKERIESCSAAVVYILGFLTVKLAFTAASLILYYPAVTFHLTFWSFCSLSVTQHLDCYIDSNFTMTPQNLFCVC